MGGSHLSDILVSHSADLLDIGGTLGHGLERVAGEDKLVLLVLGDLHVDALRHDHPSDNLLANEVSDLHLEQVGLAVLFDVDVDGEMGVDVSHLVFETLGDADDQVVDERLDRSQGRNVLAVAVVDFDRDDVLLGLVEVDGNVAQVLNELSCFRLSDIVPPPRTPGAGRFGYFVPRGPSTVTSRDLMLTLTIRTGESACCVPIALHEEPSPGPRTRPPSSSQRPSSSIGDGLSVGRE